MNRQLIALMILCLSGASIAQTHIEDRDNTNIHCGNCEKWNAAQKPFNVIANTWYVGTAELSSVLITGPSGHILIDGDLPQSALQIEANIKALGFQLGDIKVIVNSHPHFDHAGGIAQLARDSGAKVLASAQGARVLRAGVIGPDDPQFKKRGNTHFPSVATVGELNDGEVIQVGPIKLMAHMTPGHTPGGASYTWRSCVRERCFDVAYLDSLNPASSDGFLFSGEAKTPNIVPLFEESIAKVGAFKCDVVLSAHPDLTDTFEKLARKTPTHNPFVALNGCRDYALDANQSLSKRVAIEREEKRRVR